MADFAQIERSLSDFWPRVRAAVRVASEELARSHTASRRYDALRAGQGIDLALLGRGDKARQVFIEIYSEGLPAKARPSRIAMASEAAHQAPAAALS